MDLSSFSFITPSTFYGKPKRKTVVFDAPESDDLTQAILEEDILLDPEDITKNDICFDLPEGSTLDSDDEDFCGDNHITAENSNTDIVEAETDNENNQSDSEDDIPLAQLIRNYKKCSTTKQKPDWNWKEIDNMYGPGSLPPFMGKDKYIERESPVEYFLSMITDDMLDEIVFQTILYANQNNKTNFNLTKHELYIFLGINIVMSYIKYPRVRLYWSSNSALRMNLIADSMSVNRYESILRYLHFTDNTEISKDNSDKLVKIRPFLDKLQQNFLAAAESEEYQSIDEQIVPLKGRLEIKQYLPKKPKKWGVKIWVRASVSGYMYRFEVYQGATGGRGTVSNLGACADVVLRLSDDLANKNHKLFFDNLFCSIPLLEELRKKKIWATGTLRTNRLQGANKILECDKEMKKRGRGSCSVASTEQENITITKWMDNNAVLIASSCAGKEPQSIVKRWCKSNKNILDVTRPFSVQFYNKNMGGVDLMDQLLALYPLRRRNKRWYIRVFMHFVDTAIINSWILYKRAGHTKMDLLEFKASVGRALINIGRNKENKRGRPRSATPPGILKKRQNHHTPNEIKLDRLGHWPKLTDIKNARRCHSSICKRKTKYICKKCMEPCCPDCFEYFHTKI